ncbi:magnetosome protein Mad12 [Candidatus Magnetomorum sp. HK-1]|nr:magnetosome protein Mad12 [Candidatus Magnetomorum sp. HK-1]
MMKQWDEYEIKKYEIRSLADIKKWEKKKYTGIQKKLQDTVSVPIDYIMNKIGEKKFHSIEKAIRLVVEKLLYASSFTIDPNRIILKAKKYGVNIKSIKDLHPFPLKMLDECNQKEIKFHKKMATIQGAIAGIGGELLVTVDLTTLLIEDFHMIQNIAYCYGFDPEELTEKKIILRIIEGGIGGSEVKFKILKDIEQLIKEQEQPETYQGINVVTTKFIDRYVKSITVAMIVRILSCSLPVISMAVSAHSNRDIIENSSQTALMVYRKRFIERKKDK